MKKAKLFYGFRHNHLVSLIGFRVDLIESGDFWHMPDESIMFEVLGVKDNKLLIKVFHVVYEGRKNCVGKHTEDSQKIYEIDLSKKWNEDNIVDKSKV